MESASLRIKFTPLLRGSSQNDSKCCLEIVPEVSSINNLEYIEWKQKSDFIEYTIPMTYRVIIKKQQSVKECKHNLEKVYHSCVDLLAHTSLTALELCSGDRTKVVSDTFILDNVKAVHQNEDILIKANDIKFPYVKEAEQNPRSGYASIDKSDQLPNDGPTNKPIKNSDKVNVDAGTNLNIINIDHNSVLNIASSIQESRFCKDSISESVETINETSTNKDGSLRKLSLTPIYSISTNENPVSKCFPILPCEPIVYRMLEPQKVNNSTVRKKDLSLDNDTRIPLNEKALQRDSCGVGRFLERKRELPEIKVAKFIEKMETEIMPLKIMLHDILRKCSFLGLTQKEQYYFNPKQFMYQKVPYNSKQVMNSEGMMIEYYKVQRQTKRHNKCNRVVYSVVCDG